MTFKLQAQAGSRRRSMWCGAAEHSEIPSPTERDEWGACTLFGTVPLLPLARVDGNGVAQPCLAAVIEGGQRHCNSEAYATPSDLSRSSTLSGQRSNTDERHTRRQRSGLSRRTVGATSWSGEGYGLLVVSAPDNTAPHYPRNHGHPCAEKVRPHRPRQIFGVPETNFGNLPQ
jgi:hypothetical protein